MGDFVNYLKRADTLMVYNDSRCVKIQNKSFLNTIKRNIPVKHNLSI